MNESTDSQRFQNALRISAGFVLLLWLIKCLQWWFDVKLQALAVFPRDPSHLLSILTAPLVHGSVTHLISNSPSLIVLGTSLLFGYPKAAKIILPIIWIGSGLGVWLFARSAHHLGASGLTFGMMFFVFTSGALRWDRRAIALSMIVFFLYGGMIWGIFPNDPGISYEYHLFGAILGVLGAIFLKRLDPSPPQKKYSWETENEADDEDPYWWDDSAR